MKIDRERIKKIEARETVVLVTTYIPKWDDGYGSWDRGKSENIVGKTLDDPELETNLDRVIREILAQKDVKDGFQKSLFHLEERKIRYVSLKIGDVEIVVDARDT